MQIKQSSKTNSSKSSNSKKISVLMLTYNNLPEVKKCLKSLTGITKRKDVLEWIILDNGSTDGTAHFLKQFSKNQPKVNVIYSKINTGVAGGRKILLEKARGEILLLLDSDVIAQSKDFVTILLKALKKPGVGIVGCRALDFSIKNASFDKKELNYEGFADFVEGYCTLFDRKILQAGCEMDLYYSPYWAEDADFCLQIKEKTGLKAYAVSLEKTGLLHKNSKTNKGSRLDRKKKVLYLALKFSPKISFAKIKLTIEFILIKILLLFDWKK